MTLILGMSKAEGLYLSADFRVTEYPSGRIVDDASVKMLTIDFPPEGGSRALLAYTGLAILPDGTPVGVWLAETLRGESEYPDQAMAHLRKRLNRDIAPTRVGTILNALVVEGAAGERRLFGGFSNLRVSPTGNVEVLDEFDYIMRPLEHNFFFCNGSGAPRVLADHLSLAERQLGIRPRRAEDHMKLLATINRRVAAKTATVSPACHVAFIPAAPPKPGKSDPRFGPKARNYTRRGESAPIVMPHLLFGVDVSVLLREMLDRMGALAVKTDPQSSDVDRLNRALERRP